MKAYFPVSSCEDGCKYLQGRLQVLAGKVASISVEGCSALQDGLQCTAGRVAVHCV